MRGSPSRESAYKKFSLSAGRSPHPRRGDPSQIDLHCRSKRFCKTTLTRWNPELFKEIPLLDPDAIANTLQALASALFPMAAARYVLKTAGEHLKKAESVAVETTLAGKNYLQMMLEARNRGFEIMLVYIGTENVEINLARIRNRVLAGGHDVPEEDSGDATDAAFKIFQSQSNV